VARDTELDVPDALFSYTSSVDFDGYRSCWQLTFFKNVPDVPKHFLVPIIFLAVELAHLDMVGFDGVVPHTETIHHGRLPWNNLANVFSKRIT
jgi:hypothetical protein